MNVGIFLSLFGVAILAIIFLVVIAKTGRSANHDVDRNRLYMQKCEQLAASASESDRHMAVVRADSLLGKVLERQGIEGRTVGERMKKARFSNADSVWSAHKLRNRIAHESEVKVSPDSARRALSGFKQAMKDMGAL